MLAAGIGVGEVEEGGGEVDVRDLTATVLTGGTPGRG